MQAQVRRQPPLVPVQHHPCHPVPLQFSYVLSPSIPSGSAPVVPDSYVLPAAISVVAVWLVTVLTAVFGVVICIITRRHKTRKSLDMQCHSSIHYPNTQNDATFKDNQFYSSQSTNAKAAACEPPE